MRQPVPYAARCCRSSVVEHCFGKAEVGSSILPGSTRINRNTTQAWLYGFRTLAAVFTYNFALCSYVVLSRFAPKSLILLALFTLGYSLTKGKV